MFLCFCFNFSEVLKKSSGLIIVIPSSLKVHSKFTQIANSTRTFKRKHSVIIQCAIQVHSKSTQSSLKVYSKRTQRSLKANSSIFAQYYQTAMITYLPQGSLLVYIISNFGLQSIKAQTRHLKKKHVKLHLILIFRVSPQAPLTGGSPKSPFPLIK